MNHEAYVDHYITALKDEGKKPGTLKQYTSDLGQFLSWLNTSENQTLHTLQTTDIHNYAKHLKSKSFHPATMKRHLSVIHQFLEFHQLGTNTVPEQDLNLTRTIPLTSSDFISQHEMNILLKSMQQPIQSAARDTLINRNIAIVHLLRYTGLRPKDVSRINMNMVNLAQSTIEYTLNGNRVRYSLFDEQSQYIRDYLTSIDQVKRPRMHSNDPLFVAFNNRSQDYQYEYVSGQPKRLTVRSIQEMIKDEVIIAGLRKLSAKHLRNSCILDHMSSGESEKEILRYFHLTHPFSLHRFKKYRESAGFS